MFGFAGIAFLSAYSPVLGILVLGEYKTALAGATTGIGDGIGIGSAI